MKIRTDFVSNSSSSSFVLWGISFDKNELEQKLRDANILKGECDDEEYYNIIDQWIDEQNFKYDEYICGDDEVVFGLKPDMMKDDETLKQFKERIFTKLVSKKLPIASINDINLYQGVNADGDIIFD